MLEWRLEKPVLALRLEASIFRYWSAGRATGFAAKWRVLRRRVLWVNTADQVARRQEEPPCWRQGQSF